MYSNINPGSILTKGILACALCFVPVAGIIFGAKAKSAARAFLNETGTTSGQVRTGSILGTLGLVFSIIFNAMYLILFLAAIAAA